jgi:hypothetical protein
MSRISLAPASRWRQESLPGLSTSKAWWVCLMTDTLRPRPVMQGITCSISVVLPEPDQPAKPNTFIVSVSVATGAAGSAPPSGSASTGAKPPPGCGSWWSGPVEARGDELDLAPIDVVAQVHLEIHRRARDLHPPLGGRHEGLGDVVAGKDLVEHALGELVAAVGAAAAETAGRLEEQAARRAQKSSARSRLTASVRGTPAWISAMLASSAPRPRRASGLESSTRLRLSAYRAWARGCGVMTAEPASQASRSAALAGASKAKSVRRL